MWARFYANDLGRFYATDPAGSDFSSYGSRSGNPISLVDPTGAVSGTYWRRLQDWRNSAVLYQIQMKRNAEEQGEFDNGTNWMPDMTDYDVWESEWVSSFITYGNWMADNHAGWGTTEYQYFSRDEAARAGYYEIISNVGFGGISAREYGGNIYSNGNGTYSISGIVVGTEDEAGRQIVEWCALREEALKTGHIEYGGVFAAAIFHTHPSDEPLSGCSQWDPGDLCAASQTSERTIYLLRINGQLDRFTWPHIPADIPDRDKMEAETRYETIPLVPARYR